MSESKLNEKGNQLQQTLIDALLKSHYDAAINNQNISKQSFQVALAGSGSPLQAVCAGLLSTGGIHAPVIETRDALRMFRGDREGWKAIARNQVEYNQKIPGLGNSFFRDCIDPAFMPAYNAYQELHGFLNGNSISLLDDYAYCCNQVIFKSNDKDQYLHPNAALITAAACELMEALPFIELWFFISARSRAWLEIISENKQG